MTFELPPLKFQFDALEPTIDARTVEIHYTKHHATYLKNLNAALEKHPELNGMTIEQLMGALDKVPEDIRTAVRNNGGGYFNHVVYWEAMGPKGGEPKGKLAEAIQKTFGDFPAFKSEMEKAGLGRFGSGYAWLSKKPDGSILIHSTANQDSPLADGLTPLLTVDIWEHAYYLKYQNRRADYLAAFWNVVDWSVVESRFEK
ncbi:MAG: superoxide dismutase [Anaerolineaceae bacterium]